MLAAGSCYYSDIKIAKAREKKERKENTQQTRIADLKGLKTEAFRLSSLK